MATIFLPSTVMSGKIMRAMLATCSSSFILVQICLTRTTNFCPKWENGWREGECLFYGIGLIPIFGMDRPSGAALDEVYMTLVRDDTEIKKVNNSFALTFQTTLTESY